MINVYFIISIYLLIISIMYLKITKFAGELSSSRLSISINIPVKNQYLDIKGKV